MTSDARGQLEHREHLAHGQALGHQLAEAPGLAGAQRQRPGLRVHAEKGVAHLERGARRHLHLGDARALEEGAVGAAQVAHQEAGAGGRHLEVRGGHAVVAQAQGVALGGAHAAGSVERRGLAHVRALHHHELTAWRLARVFGLRCHPGLGHAVSLGGAILRAMSAPSTIGPFEVLEKVGQGGMGEVFRARAFGASGFEKVVAVKRLLPALVGEPDAEAMFLEEARLQARLSHPNLVQAHDLGVADGVPWVRLDWVDGANLELLARRGPVEVPVALHVALQVARGLAALHRAVDDGGRPLGLVHRDVSASNVLLSRDGEVKLADFGITKATQRRDETRGGVRKGKYAAMSPEQVSGRPLTAASDQFALGSTLLELINGRAPFEGATPLETMDRVRAAPPPGLDALEEDVRGVLARLLAKAAVARFANDDAVLDALEAVTATRAVTPRALAAWVRARLGGLTHP